MRRLLLLPAVLLPFITALSAMAQSATTPPAQSQAQSQSQTPAQTDSADQPQSLADAARAANAQKDKPKAKHVFNDDNLSSVRGTISVVGDGSSGGSSDGDKSSAGQGNVSSASKDEAYWRKRAQAIKDQIADVDRADCRQEGGNCSGRARVLRSLDRPFPGRHHRPRPQRRVERTPGSRTASPGAVGLPRRRRPQRRCRFRLVPLTVSPSHSPHTPSF